MSTSLYWEPVTRNTRSFEGNSRFQTILEETFGIPTVLKNSDVQILGGMEACGYKGARELIDAIFEFEEIRISAE